MTLLIKNPDQRIWYALWALQLNDGTRSIVGDLSFKGLNNNGIILLHKGYLKKQVLFQRELWGSKDQDTSGEIDKLSFP